MQDSFLCIKFPDRTRYYTWKNSYGILGVRFGGNFKDAEAIGDIRRYERRGVYAGFSGYDRA